MSDPSEESAVCTPADLRLVPAAVATWSGCWCATSGQADLIAVAMAVAVAVLVAGGLRRSIVTVAVALALLTSGGAGTLHEQRLTSGPVAELASQRAVVSAVVVTTADPSIRVVGPMRPPSLAVRAAVVAVAGRGEGWRVRLPVVVMVSGPLAAWLSAPVGSRWAVEGRLEPPEPGSGMAAELRVRRAEFIAPPGSGLRVVERVRAGLRAAVQHRGADARGLVPALVLGDTSAVPPDLVEAFKVGGLTHLTAVSGVIVR